MHIRRLIVQQCCYGLDGNLLLNAGRPNVGTPLYETQTMLVTNIENTILPLLYCCKVGTGERARCEDYIASFKSNDGSGYMQPQPGRIPFLVPKCNVIGGCTREL